MKSIFLIHSLTISLPASCFEEIKECTSHKKFFQQIGYGHRQKGLYKSAYFKYHKCYNFFYSDFAKELHNAKIDNPSDAVDMILDDITGCAVIKPDIDLMITAKISRLDLKIDALLLMADVKTLRNIYYFDNFFPFQKDSHLEMDTLYLRYNSPRETTRFHIEGDTIIDTGKNLTNRYDREEVLYGAIFNIDEEDNKIWLKPDNKTIKFRYELRYETVENVERFVMKKRKKVKKRVSKKRSNKAYLVNFFYETDLKEHFINVLNGKIKYLKSHTKKTKFRFNSWISKYLDTQLTRYLRYPDEATPCLWNVDIKARDFKYANRIKRLINKEVYRIQAMKIRKHFDYVDREYRSIHTSDEDALHRAVIHHFSTDMECFNTAKKNSRVREIVQIFERERSKLYKNSKDKKKLKKVITDVNREMKSLRTLVFHLIRLKDILRVFEKYKHNLETLDKTPYVPDPPVSRPG